MYIDYSNIEKNLDWAKKQILLNERTKNAAKRILKRGQVYRCNLGIGVGNEMQKERPCVIVQNDIGNKKSPNTIVVPITHGSANLPFVISIQTQYEADGTTIKLDGQVNVSNIRVVSKARLGNLITNLKNNEIKLIDAAIASNIDLMKYYAKLQKKYDAKLTYIAKIKQERNEAQDILKRICDILDVPNENVIEKIKILNKENG
ncbi:MAG: type II toxin-antitoxin system PemK/MazF family toxin [Phascolarctobacterium sp.]|nr:MAG: type II toxin-antitoxin system PemK/MazF family toxin [Phascolarctobacterium sp.]